MGRLSASTFVACREVGGSARVGSMVDSFGAMWGTARISADGRYRYLLTRRWGRGPTATFIMLNPSTADADTNDATIRKCLGYCRRWGCGLLQVINLFAVRATSPADMMAADDPVGPDTREAFEDALEMAVNNEGGPGLVVYAWGAHGGFMDRDLEVMGWLGAYPRAKPVCLGMTKDGHPKHPLYVPYRPRLRPYRGPPSGARRRPPVVGRGKELGLKDSNLD
jgi:hypothetical protein